VDFNPWRETGAIDKDTASMKKRDLFTTLKESLEARFIEIIIGLRRVGKTVLMHQLIAYLLNNGIDSNGDFPREGKKRGRKKKIKKRIFGRIVKYIMDHPRSTLKDVARYLKEEYKLEVSVKTIERELEEYDLSDLYKLVREKEKRSVHVNYAGGWLLAPFIADMVKKTEQAFGELAGSVEAILTLFFLSVTGLRPVDPENPVRV